MFMAEYLSIIILVIGVTIVSVYTYWVIKQRKCFSHSASYPPAKVPAMPSVNYLVSEALFVIFLSLAVTANLAFFVYLLKDGCIMLDEINGIITVFLLSMPIPVFIFVVSKLYPDEKIHYLCIENGTINFLTQKGNVMRSCAAENVEAILVCDVTVITYGNKSEQRDRTSKTDRYIALLSNGERAYMPTTIDTAFNDPFMTDDYIMIPYAPESLAVLKQVFDVPFHTDEEDG